MKSRAVQLIKSQYGLMSVNIYLKKTSCFDMNISVKIKGWLNLNLAIVQLFVYVKHNNIN